jgi:hypothetical protein
MARPKLFIGVVSHQGSRFAESCGSDGLAASLARQVPDTQVCINTSDLLDEVEISLTHELIRNSLSAEIDLDREWARYLGRATSPRWYAIHVMRRLRRSLRRLTTRSPSEVRRLLNIELSHRDLMRAGLESGAPWILILEDDAYVADTRDLATGIEGIINEVPPPGFVNLSLSFEIQELGIANLLTPAKTAWSGSAVRAVLASSRPITNTVCAILYSRSFLEKLTQIYDSMPMTPVVPIDWKFNRVLMHMFQAGSVGSGDCWLVEPAPVVQMSMHGTGILPP